MSDIKLFSVNNGDVSELAGQSAIIEKSLQTLIERNLDEFLGIRFLASEYSTGPVHRGRIDTLGIDENDCPVIIEYKRATNESVILQALYYLNWLLDHKGEFSMMVMDKFGKEVSDEVNWSSPRIVCIAGGYTKYDTHATKELNHNIELFKYKYFDDNLFLLELVNATTVNNNYGKVHGSPNPSTSDTFIDKIDKSDKGLIDLYEKVKAYLLALGDDVQEKPQVNNMSYKRIKNFVCVQVKPTQRKILLYLSLDPDTIQLEKGFFRNVKDIGHYGTGDTELTIKSTADFEKAKPFIDRSYNNN